MITTRYRTASQWHKVAQRIEEGWRPDEGKWLRLLRDFNHDVALVTGVKEIRALAKFMIAVEGAALRARRERREAKKAEFFTRRLGVPDAEGLHPWARGSKGPAARATSQ